MHILTDHNEVVGADNWADAMGRFAVVIPSLAPAKQTVSSQAKKTGTARHELALDESTHPPMFLEVLASKGTSRQPGDQLTAAFSSFGKNDGRSILYAMDAKYSPTKSEVVGYFGDTNGIKEPAKTIAKSYRHWQRADYESAVSVLFPALERVVRHTCSRLGIEVYQKEYSPESPDHVRTLGPLLEELNPYLGETRFNYMRSCLTGKASLNLRNELAHGKIMRIEEWHYVCLFHSVAVLAWLNDDLNTRAKNAGIGMCTSVIHLRGFESVSGIVYVPDSSDEEPFDIASCESIIAPDR